MQIRTVAALSLLLATIGCGGGDSQPSTATGINTLAYVVTECHENARQVVVRQALKVRRRTGETITVMEFPQLGPLPSFGLCSRYAQARFGDFSVVAAPFQRLGVSPDGSTVIFEVNGDVSIVAGILTHPIIPPESAGIYVVREDGGGLHRIASASREPSFRYMIDPESPSGADANVAPVFSFRPDGQAVTFTDLGPGPDGELAPQVVTLDLLTGAHTQVTSLSAQPPPFPIAFTVGAPSYRDANSIVVVTDSADNGQLVLHLKADGSGLIGSLPQPAAIPNSPLDPRFLITSGTLRAGALRTEGGFAEVFGSRQQTLLQLTTFRRGDTGNFGSCLVSRDQQRVLLTASADPFGTNPEEDCQIFSVAALGGDLRQVTRFATGKPSTFPACSYQPTMGCAARLSFHELATDTVVFDSNCDPLGTNPNGGALFSMQFDGSGLAQLTSTRGVGTDPDGSLSVELPGPSAYPEVFR